MKAAVALVGFALLWAVTFLPAWILLVKLAVATLAQRKDWLRIVGLFLLYELVIALPYLFLLVVVGKSAGLLSGFVGALVLVALLTALFQALGARKVQQSLWKYYSHFYDNLLRFYPYRELVQLVGDRALSRLHDGSRVVDLGAGTGNVSNYILQHKPEVQLQVVEPVLSMLQRAKAKLSHDGSKVTFLQTNALDFVRQATPGSLDVVVLSNVLYILEDRDQFWQHLMRALAPEGVAIITNSDRGGSAPLIRYHKQHDRAWRLYHPGLLMVGFIDNLISQFAAGGAFFFIPRETIEQEVHKHGGVATDFQRCYGGEQDGVNLLFTVAKRKQV